MFTYADADCDGRINWSEFQTMINPPAPPAQWATRPPNTDLTQKTTLVHPHTLSVTSIMASSAAKNPLREGKPLLINKSKIVPLCMSETHVSASWTQIGLKAPVNRK